MTEDAARDWIRARYGIRALARLTILCDVVRAENHHQNLIAPSTVATIWNRHIVDSAQLIDLVTYQDGAAWIDIGSGAGFPGVVIAALANATVVLVEPRKRRAGFLVSVVEALDLKTTAVCSCKVQDVSIAASIVSARAVAPLANLFEWASTCTTPATHWVLPKGRSAREEVSSVQEAWHGTFHVEHSITDHEAMIVVATGVKRR